MYRNYKYYLARDIGYNLFKNIEPLDWMAKIIWFILTWPIYAAIAFLFLAGCGIFGDGNHNTTNDNDMNQIMYPEGMEFKAEMDASTKRINQEEMAQERANQYQLEHNPDHQIH